MIEDKFYVLKLGQYFFSSVRHNPPRPTPYVGFNADIRFINVSLDVNNAFMFSTEEEAAGMQDSIGGQLITLTASDFVPTPPEETEGPEEPEDE